MTPLIRVEVDHMKQAMVHAFNETQVKLDEQFKEAISHALEPGKIQVMLNEAAEKYIKQAVDDEVQQYFLEGRGRQAILEIVKEKLDTCLEATSVLR